MYKDSYLNCNLYVTETQLLQLQFVPMLQEYTGFIPVLSHWKATIAEKCFPFSWLLYFCFFKMVSYVMLHFTLGWVLFKKLPLQQ